MYMQSCVYTMHMIHCKSKIDGEATEADGGASAPVGPNVATPLWIWPLENLNQIFKMTHFYDSFIIFHSK